MDEEKKNEGVSVKDIEGYAKKHRFELFFGILFVLASLFTLIFWGPIWSVLLAGAGALISVFLPNKVEEIAAKMSSMVLSKEGALQLIIAIVALIVAIFLAPVIFFLMGLHAGKSMIHRARESSHTPPPPSDQ